MEGNLLHERIRPFSNDLGDLVQAHSERRRLNHRILFLQERLDRWSSLHTGLFQEAKPVQRIQEKPCKRLDNPLFGGSDYVRLAELLVHSTANGHSSDSYANKPLLDLYSGLFVAS